MKKMFLFLLSALTLGVQAKNVEFIEERTHSNEFSQPMDVEAIKSSMTKDEVSMFNDALASQSPFAVLYEHCDYRGAKYVIYGDMKKVGGIWNDATSSVRLYNGAGINLFEHDSYNGQSVYLTSSNACLANNEFNDTVSSLQLIKKYSDKHVILNENCNYAGRSMALRNSSGFIGGYWNDRVSSIRLRNGARAQLHRDSFYRGGYINVSGSDACLADEGFNDMLSSIIVK